MTIGPKATTQDRTALLVVTTRTSNDERDQPLPSVDTRKSVAAASAGKETTMGQLGISRRVALTLLGAWVGNTANFITASEPTALAWQTDYARAQQLRVAANRPLLVFVTSDGCPFCHKMLKTTYGDSIVASEISEAFVPILVNGTQQTKIAQQFGIRIYPTTFVVGADNRVIDKIEGFLPPEKFRDRLAAAARLMAMRPDASTTR